MLPSFFNFYIFAVFIREQISHPRIDLSVMVLISDFEDQISNLLVKLALIFILSKVEDITSLTFKNTFNL